MAAIDTRRYWYTKHQRNDIAKTVCSNNLQLIQARYASKRPVRNA